MPITESDLKYEEMEKLVDQGISCRHCKGLVNIAWGGWYGIPLYILRCPEGIEHLQTKEDLLRPRIK